MKTKVIEVENLSKTFKLRENRKNTLRELVAGFFNQGKLKKFKALDNINFNIHQGEFVGIVGRNGSGKSTLLKIIAGIYSPDKKSKLVTKGKIVPFLELGVGFNTELSGRENVYLNGVILGMTRKYIKSKFKEIVEFAELTEFINEPVKNYSSGMMVRLAFSIAIQSNADIYILDEVLAVGDISFQRKCLSIFNDLKKQGKTVIYVSHSIETIEQYCDRAILIEDHKVLMDSNPSDVVAEYQKIMSPVNLHSEDKKEEKDRWGNGEVKIEEVKFLGKEKDLIYSNEDIKMEINFKALESFEDFAIGFAIYKTSGEVVTGTNSRNIVEKRTELTKGDHSYIVSINAKYFLSGEYDITIAAYNMKNMTPLDYLHQYYRIVINNTNKDIGVVSLPFKLEIQK